MASAASGCSPPCCRSHEGRLSQLALPLPIRGRAAESADMDDDSTNSSDEERTRPAATMRTWSERRRFRWLAALEKGGVLCSKRKRAVRSAAVPRPRAAGVVPAAGSRLRRHGRQAPLETRPRHRRRRTGRRPSCCPTLISTLVLGTCSVLAAALLPHAPAPPTIPTRPQPREIPFSIHRTRLQRCGCRMRGASRGLTPAPSRTTNPWFNNRDNFEKR